MNQQEIIENTEKYDARISNLEKYSHSEIANLYRYINETVLIPLENNSQSLNRYYLRLDQLENKLQQQEQSSNLNHDDILSIKQQIVELKIQFNGENSKSNHIYEEKLVQNCEQINQIPIVLESKTDCHETNDIDFLKYEIKILKEKMNCASTEKQSFDVNTPLSQINVNQIESDESLSSQLQKENHQIKSDLNSIKSKIKKIISRTLNNENLEIKDLSFEEENSAISESNYETTETSESYDNNELDEISSQKLISCDESSNIKEKMNKLIQDNESLKNDINSLKIEIGKFIENQNQLNTIPDHFIHELIAIKSNCSISCNEFSRQVNQITSENEFLKNKINSLQSEIAKYIKQQEDNVKSNNKINEEMDISFTANDAKEKAIEARHDSIDARFKANDAVLRSKEAEYKATEANEKADRIVSDNDKMNVDIKCLKYEVKKLRSRVKELEISEIYTDLADRIDYTNEKVYKLMDEIKNLKTEKSADFKNSSGSIPDESIAQIKNENASLKKDIKSLKSEIKKIKEDQTATESSVIPDDFIQKIKDAHTQSARAYEKASKAHIGIFENQNKTNEMNDKVEKLIDENERLKSDLLSLISDVEKIKGSIKSDDENKSQKKKDKKRKNSSIKV